MSKTIVQPYLFFGGRCEEAIAFYRTAVGAEIEMLMHYDEAPEQPPEGMLAPGFERKVMHASFKIGETTVMASDGCGGPDEVKFGGFSLSLAVKRSRRESRFHGARRGWLRDDAARQNILVAVLRHAHRPLRPRLDG